MLVVSISGCNVLGGPNGNNIKKSIVEQTPKTALKKIKFEDYGEGDSVLYYLEKGSLHHMAGQHKESQDAYEKAKEKMESLYTTSVSKSVGSVLLNDNTTDYEGEAFENIMAHVNQLVSYMETGNIENAGIIVHQLNTKLEQLTEKKNDDNGKVYKCDPYANYLSGIVYEQSNARGHWDNARISYEKSRDCYKKSIFKLGVPKQVKHALKKVKKNAKKLSKKAKNNGELIFILDEGFVVAKSESSLSVAAASTKKIRQVKITLPKMPKNNPHLIKGVKVKINGKNYKAERVHNLDAAARATLDERLPAIQARAVARVLKNHALQKEAGDKSGYFAQLAAVVATNVLEKADVRSWRSLPHTIWMSRTSLKPDTYDIEVELLGSNGKVLNIKQFKKVVIEKAAIKSLRLRWGASPSRNKDKSVDLYLPVIL